MNTNYSKILYITMTICAFFTHHTRDATRHGIWIYPFGSIPPIPYKLYLFLTICIPYFLSVLIKLCDRSIIHRYKVIFEV